MNDPIKWSSVDEAKLVNPYCRPKPPGDSPEKDLPADPSMLESSLIASSVGAAARVTNRVSFLDKVNS